MGLNFAPRNMLHVRVCKQIGVTHNLGSSVNQAYMEIVQPGHAH